MPSCLASVSYQTQSESKKHSALCPSLSPTGMQLPLYLPQLPFARKILDLMTGSWGDSQLMPIVHCLAPTTENYSRKLCMAPRMNFGHSCPRMASVHVPDCHVLNLHSPGKAKHFCFATGSLKCKPPLCPWFPMTNCLGKFSLSFCLGCSSPSWCTSTWCHHLDS